MQVINTNVPSLNAQGNLNKSLSALGTSIQRLSSGLRINSAKDDAAGLAISDRMTTQITGDNQAMRNSNDGISLSQTAEGAMAQMTTMLQRIRVLAVQSANDTNSTQDRVALNQEVGQLLAELDRFARDVEFNGKKLLNGSLTTSVFQVGANAGQTITATTANFRTKEYGAYQVGNSLHNSAVMQPEAYGNGAAYNISGWGMFSGTVLQSTSIISLRGFIGAANVTGSTYDTAATLADKINAQTSKTSITANAVNIAALHFGDGREEDTGLYNSGSYTFQVLGNQDPSQYSTVTFAVTRRDDGSLNLSQAVDSINQHAAKTGIVARQSDDGQNMILTNDAGGPMLLKALALPHEDTVLSGGYYSSGNSGHFMPSDPPVEITGIPGTVSGTTIGFGGQLTLNSSATFSLQLEKTDDESGRPGATVRDGVFGSQGLLEPGDVIPGELQTVNTMDVRSVETSMQTIRVCDGALAVIDGQRALFGAIQSRFEMTVSNLQNTVENLSAARSRVMDADFAAETSALTRAQVLQQAGLAMLAQSNQIPTQVLSLLRG